MFNIIFLFAQKRLGEVVWKQDFETERQQQQVTERDLERQVIQLVSHVGLYLQENVKEVCPDILSHHFATQPLLSCFLNVVNFTNTS